MRKDFEARFPMRTLLSVFVIILGLIPSASCQWAPMVTDANADTRIQWWRDAKFGLFIHWGLYSIPGRGEWVQWNEQIPVDKYAKLAGQFQPDKFDPNAWATTARDGHEICRLN